MTHIPLFLSRLWQLAGCDISQAEKAFVSDFTPSFRAAGDAGAQEIFASLTQQGIPLFPSPLANDTWTTTPEGEQKLRQSPEFTEGKIYLQSISSQIPARIAQLLAPGAARILDMCAAPGGKTTLLSRLFPNAQIVALEKDKVRFQKLEFNIRRQKCTNVTAHACDALSPGKQLTQEKFDIILLDVPCTGTGAISSQNQKAIERIENTYDDYVRSRSELQKKLLLAAEKYLNKGGILIYSTCSIDARENEEVARASGLTPLSIPESITTAFLSTKMSPEGFVTVFPRVENEGFFCAVFQKENSKE